MEDDLIRDVVGRTSVSSVCMMYDPAYVCGRYRSATVCMTCNMHYWTRVLRYMILYNRKYTYLID